MTHISVPIKIVHTTKTAALNQPRFRKCTRERRACQFSPYFRGPPNCTMFTVGHVAGDLFRGSQLDSLSWCALCHLLYLSQCSHYLASHMEIKECFNVFQCHITFYIRSIWFIWFIHASFLSVPFNVWLDNCNQLRSMNHFQGMHLEKNECLAAIHMESNGYVQSLATLATRHPCALCWQWASVHPVLNSGRRSSNRSSKLIQTSPAEQESSFSLVFLTRLRNKATSYNMSGCNLILTCMASLFLECR